MKFNYASKKRQFMIEWAKTAKEYADAGMSPEAIEIMREYDWERFKSDRIWALHIQDVPEMEEEEEIDDFYENALLVKKYLERVSTEYDAFGNHSRYWWINEIDSGAMAKVLSSLTDEDIELLTLAIFEGYTHEEIAFRLSIPRRTVAWRLKQLLTDLAIVSGRENR